MAEISESLSDEVKRQYQIKDNTFLKEAKSDVVDRIEIEVGDIKQPQEFLPQVKIMRWDNEVNASFRLIDDEPKTIATEDEKIKLIGVKKEVHLYNIASCKEHPEGGYEFEIILKEKPTSNKLEFSIETKGVDFHYQPPLTQKEKNEGMKRPENTIGSYAIYCSDKKTNYVGGKLYRTGKVGHLYRPKMEDAGGNWVWGELEIDTKKKKLVVTIPQDFLNSAIYPINHAAGLTIGYTTLGTLVSYYANNNSWTAGKKEQRVGGVDAPASSGNLSKITIGSTDDNNTGTNVNIKVFVNEVDSVASNSHGQIATAIGTDIDLTHDDAWYDINIIGSVVAETDYIINAVGDSDSVSDPSAINVLADAVGGALRYVEGGADGFQYDTHESPWTTGNSSSGYAISIYATYTVAVETKTVQAKASIKKFGITKTVNGKARIETAGKQEVVDTYYFDASNSGPTDVGSVWTDDAKGFDGSILTYAYTTTKASTLEGGGTTAPSSGGAITQVRARIYGAAETVIIGTIRLGIWTEGKGQYLGYVGNATEVVSWSDYVELTIPTGGWDWDKVSKLVASVDAASAMGEGLDWCNFYRAEIEVTYLADFTVSAKARVKTSGITKSINAKAWIQGLPTKPYRIYSGATNYWYWDLDDANKATAIRFTPWSNIDVTEVSVMFTNVVSAPTYRIGIRADDDPNNKPATQWLGSGTVTPSTEWNWSHVTIPKITLQAGVTYWIVIIYESGTIGESNYVSHYMRSSELDSRYPYDSQEGNFDASISVNSGTTWMFQNEPGAVFLLNRSFGNPITTNVLGRVYGTRLRGQYYKFRNNITANKLAMYVQKGGTPGNDLLYEIRDEDTNTVQRSGTLATEASVGTEFAKFEVTLSSPFTFNAGKGYRIIVKMTDGDSSNYYDCYGDSIADPEAVMNHATYGGDLISQFCASNDGGTSWVDPSNYYKYDTYLDIFMERIISAKANILSGVTQTQTVSTVARIQKLSSQTVTAKGRIQIASTQTVTAKGQIQVTAGTVQTITAKAKIVCITKTVLVTPPNLSSQISPLYLVWEIPTCCLNRNIHANVQVDKTDNTFTDLEKDLFSYRDSDFEYWDGGDWQPYPTAGVTSAYYGNQARVQVSLTAGGKWWRAKGGVK